MMHKLYWFHWFLGALFVFLFVFWYVLPTDIFTNLYVGEAAASVFLAGGLTSFFVGYQLRREIIELTEAMRKQARAEAEAAVREHVVHLESDLQAARDYIARMEARR